VSTIAGAVPRQRRRIRVIGTVQGVGFRPFVYRAAVALGLAGEVSNDASGVLIEAEGQAAALDELARLLVEASPPLARVAQVTSEPLAPQGDDGFCIVASRGEGPAVVPVSVDVAPCDACLAEMTDRHDRRHRYPFINCTDCGPRYTITRRVPYDRRFTTMAGFDMCPACRTEYDDPGDRRFHAQPNACPDCGPRLALHAPDRVLLATGDDALIGALDGLRAGAVVAIKGVGGFHLAVDAADAGAVATLRRRKARDDKPFALLVADLAGARKLVQLDPAAAAALTDARRPIVLAARRAHAGVAPGVAPGLPELGVMLPPTPLHHLLAADHGGPLVLTSGNLTDEPIAYEDPDAFARLARLVDAVLTHDRPIHIRCDDSVLRADVAGGLQPVRRSRGEAPEPIELPVPARRPVLALGAELKSTIAVARERTAVISHHLGDLEHPATYRAFLQAIDHLLHLQQVAPEVVVHDLHPEYLSTKFANELDLPLVGVQHHHAHVASCLAEHGRTDEVVGVAFDGLGWGDDRTLWGGELLVCDLRGYERVGHLAPIPLPGGANAIREPWRTAVAWAVTALGAEAVEPAVSHLDDRWAAMRDLVLSGRPLPTTSAGRLFDAVAALLGIRSRVTYEGQAAIELEALARAVSPAAAPRYDVDLQSGNTLVLDPAPLLRAVVADRDAGVDPAVVAAGFHLGLAAGTAAAVIRIASDRSLATVALSGGVFQNAVLTEQLCGRLKDAGLEVLVHRRVPPNDGGISLGQAAVGACLDD